MFNSGPITSIIGSGIIVLTWLNQIFLEQQLPTNKHEWFMFVVENLTGLGALFAKDFNKSNSGTNVPAHTVKS